MNRILELPRPLPINFSWFSQFQGNILFWFLMSSLQKKKISSRFKILFTVKWERDENVHFMKSVQYMYVYKIMMYSGNQRLQSVGNNDWRAKRFCSNAVLCISFMWQMVKTRMIRIRVIEGPNVHDQIALCVSIHS